MSIYLIPNTKVYEDRENKNEEVFMMAGIISTTNNVAIGRFIEESRKVVTRIKEQLPDIIESN